MRLVSDSVFGEVELTASAEALAGLASAVAKGDGFIAATLPLDGDALAGIDIRNAPGPGVRLELADRRRVLVISGDPAARAILADNLQAMAAADGGHLHIDHYPDHPYLREGSVSLVVNSPLGGMPTR